MNIAEILKYCPKGTKLYSLVDGEVTLENICNTGQYSIEVITNNGDTSYFTKDGKIFANRPNGECVLFPSKDQRDWSKFRLPTKPGDIMMMVDGSCPFITTNVFNKNAPICYCSIGSDGKLVVHHTWYNNFYIPASEEAKKELFDKMAEAGYKWNADTLELEKIEPKFKEGDVLINSETNTLFLSVGVMINDKIQGYYLFANDKFACSYVSTSLLKLASITDRNKLYSVLIRKGYIYDKEQHSLIKQKFKAFDKVLVKNSKTGEWYINYFSHYRWDKNYPYACINSYYHYCIPYEGNEYLLGTTDSPICVDKKE